jgi:predicted DCC family thiol-disulfide oxidoreductase YuxK
VGSTVVFYDGTCGLCNRFVQFVLQRDHAGRVRFAPLQGELARQTLTARGRNPEDLDTVYVIADWGTPRERVLDRSRAVLHTVRQLGGGWGMLARIASLVPSPLANVIYRLVASTRYRIFGQAEVCVLPKPEWRTRFME